LNGSGAIARWASHGQRRNQIFWGAALATKTTVTKSVVEHRIAGLTFEIGENDRVFVGESRCAVKIEVCAGGRNQSGRSADRLRAFGDAS
jgi:hypothetical protein